MDLLTVLVLIAALAFALLLAYLWNYTLRRAGTAAPLTLTGRAWNAAVFVAWLALLAEMAWRWWTWRG